VTSRFPPPGPRLSRKFPDFNGTIKTLRFPVVRLASLHFCRSAIPRVAAVRFVSSIATAGQTTDQELVTRSLCRTLHVETTGPPRFLGNPNIHLLMVFDPGRTTGRLPKRGCRTAPAKKKTKAPTWIPLSRLNSMASGLAVYASQCRLPTPPRKTRFRPPVRLCRVRLTHWVPAKGFSS